MNLDSQGLDVVGAVGAGNEVCKIELDLIPPVIQTQWHRTDKGLHSRGGLWEWEEKVRKVRVR